MRHKCVTCDKSYSDKNSLRHLHYNDNPSHTPEWWDTCPNCNKNYESIGSHWSHNPSHIPSYTEFQLSIIEGLVMGDATVRDRDTERPRLLLATINKEYLEYLSNIFGILSTEIRLKTTAKQSAKNDRKSGFNKSAKKENYSDVYSMQLRNHPELSQFSSWYDNDKIFPDNIKLDPVTLKHWFVGDGSKIQGKRGRPHIVIVTVNEISNKEKLKVMFSEIGFENVRFDNESIRFLVEDSEKMWNYMGSPPPGFEYKWP